MASQGPSSLHRRFLAADGTDFFVGDGALNYGRESMLKLSHNAALARGLWLSLDAQRIRNPAYNRDRGPAQADALRLHVER